MLSPSLDSSLERRRRRLQTGGAGDGGAGELDLAATQPPACVRSACTDEWTVNVVYAERGSHAHSEMAAPSLSPAKSERCADGGERRQEEERGGRRDAAADAADARDPDPEQHAALPGALLAFHCFACQSFSPYKPDTFSSLLSD
eukprot:COSAG03_NODE_85_length_13653_cov_168.174057_5_plen_145_part_00